MGRHTEGICDLHVVQKGKAKTHDCGGEVGVDEERRSGLHQSLGGLVPARGETDHVRIGALHALTTVAFQIPNKKH